MLQFMPIVVVLALSLALQSAVAAGPAPNTLTAAERAAGWQLLFDGQTLDAWRGYRRETQPTPAGKSRTPPCGRSRRSRARI